SSTAESEGQFMGAKVQVIFYSTYGHVYRLAEAVTGGARAVAGSDVQVLQVAETLPADVLDKMGATEAKKAFAHVPVTDPRRLAEADGIILGTPTRYGAAAAQMRAFLDNTAGLWGSGRSSASDGMPRGGATRAVPWGTRGGDGPCTTWR